MPPALCRYAEGTSLDGGALRTCDPATASGLVATPRPAKAASIAVSGAGGGAGGAGGGAGAEVWLAVEVVPVDVTESVEESMRATASCNLPEDFDVAVAVSEARDADRLELLDELNRLAVTLEVLPLRWDVLALPVPPVDPELPEMETGLEMAVDVAGPVLPVFVADDDAFTAPELPDWATGDSTTLGDPPEPPLALPVEVESPPGLVAPCAAGPSRATATAATPVAPAMQMPPASRAFLGVVVIG
jgi:hypothetical protein